MSEQNLTVSLKDLWQLLDSTFTLMNPELHRHHQAVSYLAFRMAEAAKLSITQQHLVMQAAYLHDVAGAIQGQNATLEAVEAASRRIAQTGANLLKEFPTFAALAVIVRHCQTPYRETRLLKLPDVKLPGLDRVALPEEFSGLAEKLSGLKLKNPLFLSNLIHLADEVSLMVNPEIPVLNQVEGFLAAARKGSGKNYAPEAVEALERLAGEERVWLELAYSPERILEELLTDRPVHLDAAMQMSRLIGMVIDFRSPFTAMHSAGVAASARTLAKLAGMSVAECDMMEIAGSLHDLGKIRTPAEILEKPGKLTDEEFNVIKEHAFFSDLLLSRVHGFETLGKWASLHHEKLNGKGYPYHLKEGEIPFGAQIMAVADVFSAITEDRPYRKGMDPERVKSILRENAQRGELSPLVTELLIQHYGEVNAERERASREAGARYYRSMKEEG